MHECGFVIGSPNPSTPIFLRWRRASCSVEGDSGTGGHCVTGNKTASVPAPWPGRPPAAQRRRVQHAGVQPSSSPWRSCSSAVPPRKSRPAGARWTRPPRPQPQIPASCTSRSPYLASCWPGRRSRGPATSTARLCGDLRQLRHLAPSQLRPVAGSAEVLTCRSGGPGVSRTPGTRFRKPLLYPSELRGHEPTR